MCFQMENTLLTAQEVGQRLNCSDQTVRNLADKKIIPCIRLRPPDRGGYRFRPEDIEAFIENYGPPSVTTGVVEKEPVA